jgi:uncharacterized membrane protein
MGYMRRLAFLATFIVVAAILAFNSIAELPERVATHFYANGVASGWTSREDHRLSILLSLVALPSLLVWLMAGLPRLLNGRGQIPNSEYWFAQERRRETESFLIDHAFWLGCMTLAVVYGIHISIVRANAVTPPVLAVDRFTAIVVMYLCGLVWWLATFLRHFKRHDKHT